MNFLTIIFDELALVITIPEGAEDGLVGECVVVADEGLQVLCGLRTVV